MTGRRRRRADLFALGLAAAIGLFNAYAPAHPTLAQRFLASAILVVAAIPTFRWLAGRGTVIPFLPFFGGVYAASYALPIFLREQLSRAHYIGRIIPDEYIVFALGLSLLGLVALFIGYYGPFHRVLARLFPRVRMEWVNDHEGLGIALGVIGVLGYATKVTHSMPLTVAAFVGLLADLSILGAIIVFALQLRGRAGPVTVALLWGVVIPVRLFLAASTGATFQILEVVLVLALTYTAVRRRVPWILLGIGLASLLIIRPGQIPFRALTWTGGTGDLSVSVFQRVALFKDIIKEVVIGQATTASDAVQIVTSRLSHILTFAEVIELTPDVVPFWSGETYYPLLSKWIPRAVFPDKPLEVSGQDFGHRYGFLAPDDWTTSYNLPQLVEFYANFGVPGLMVGMFLLGILYRTLQRMFEHPRMGLGSVVGGVYVLSKLLSIESALSMVLGGVFWSIVFLALLNEGVKITVLRRRCRSGHAV